MMIESNKLLLVVCAAVGTLLAVSSTISNVGSIGAGRRSLAERKPAVDDRPICAGPRTSSSQEQQHYDSSLLAAGADTRTATPLYQHATYGLHLGQDGQYGQFNNQIVELVNALDCAMDSGGNTVVVVSNWVIDLIELFLPDDDDSWELLEREFPIVRNSTAAASLLSPIIFPTEYLMSRRVANVEERALWNVIEARRARFLRYLFSSLRGEPCHFMHQVQGYLQGKFVNNNGTATKYVAVHVRNMDGKCIEYNMNTYRADQCEMGPNYIKGILESAGVLQETNIPIILMTDMQDKDKLHRIQDAFEDGRVVVPQWDFGHGNPSMLADLVLGAMSEVFIGVQGSSASRNMGILREAFGKDESTTYIFMNKTADGKWSNYHPHHPYKWWVYADNQ